MSVHRIQLMMSLSLFAALPGCYYFAAQDSIQAAETALQDAKSQGLEKSSPYHYFAAEQYLDRARIENRESDFGSARDFADKAKEHARVSSPASTGGAAAPTPAPVASGDMEVTPVAAPPAEAPSIAPPSAPAEPAVDRKQPELVVQPEAETGGQ